MAVHAPALPRPDVWHGRFGPTLALVLVVLPFAATLVWAATRPRLDDAAVAADIRSTAALVGDHSAAMVRVGERIAAAAAASTVPDRAAWLAYAQHMVSDGRNLEALGERLRRTATVAEADPMHGGSAGVAAAVLQARWEQLRADGRATAEHGRVMVQMAADLGAGVREGILSEADVAEVRQASAGMAEAGDRIARSAGLLLASVDQMQRWMGFSR